MVVLAVLMVVAVVVVDVCVCVCVCVWAGRGGNLRVNKVDSSTEVVLRGRVEQLVGNVHLPLTDDGRRLKHVLARTHGRALLRPVIARAVAGDKGYSVIE